MWGEPSRSVGGGGFGEIGAGWWVLGQGRGLGESAGGYCPSMDGELKIAQSGLRVGVEELSPGAEVNS